MLLLRQPKKLTQFFLTRKHGFSHDVYNILKSLLALEKWRKNIGSSLRQTQMPDPFVRQKKRAEESLNHFYDFRMFGESTALKI